MFKPCGEFRWSPEGQVSQIHSHHLLVGAPGNFSDLLRSVQMLRRESGVRKSTGSYRTYSSLVKLQSRFLSLQWKTCLCAELQPWCLRLQWRTCPWAEHWWWWCCCLLFTDDHVLQLWSESLSSVDRWYVAWVIYDGHMMTWPKFPDIFLTWEEPRKKPLPGNWPDRESNPCQLPEKYRCYP